MSVTTIRVTFVDASNGSLLGVVDLTPSRLPRSFAASTTLHLGDDDWEVVRAEPSTAEDFEQTRQLRLELRHIVPGPKASEAISPNKVFFTVPTIADALPAATSVRSQSHRVYELAEDDWRQLELIHADALDAVKREFRSIERVLEEERVAGGFRTCHARRAIEAPLKGTSLTLEALRSAFTRIETTFDALAFRGGSHTIDSGFAFRSATGLVIYGIAPESRVTVLGLVPDRERKGPPLDASALGTLRNGHGLLLVDWCARVAVQPIRN